MTDILKTAMIFSALLPFISASIRDRKTAECKFSGPLQGTIKIHVTHEEDTDQILMEGILRNLSAGPHGFHVHEARLYLLISVNKTKSELE